MGWRTSARGIGDRRRSTSNQERGALRFSGATRSARRYALTVTQYRPDHTGLNDIDLPIDQGDDGDEQFDGVTECSVEQTTPCFTNTKGKFLSAEGVSLSFRMRLPKIMDTHANEIPAARGMTEIKQVTKTATSL